MAQNKASTYSPVIAKRYAKKSFTDRLFSKQYSFVGAKTVNIFSNDTVPLGEYNPDGDNRFGSPTEVGNTVQEMTLTQMPSFSLTIDETNNTDQENTKRPGEVLAAELDERMYPSIDKYRIKSLCYRAGKVASLSAVPSKTTIVDAITDGTEWLDDKLVPEDGRVLLIRNDMYKHLKRSDDFLNLETLGTKALQRGHVGEVDNMEVIKVPSSYLPTGVYFIIMKKDAAVAPMKLNQFFTHKNPPGLCGTRIEGLVYHDAFVIGTKCDAIYIAAASANVQASPVIEETATNGVVSITAAGATIYYTTDGT